MTKLQKIHDFLVEINKLLFEKHRQESEKRIKEEKKNPNSDIAHALAEHHEHTKGQLYEANYILQNFWEIIEEKDY